MVEEWEKDQACVTGLPGIVVDPAWFDENGDHGEAANVCRACPVREQCYDRIEAEVASGMRVNGFYAGRFWTTRRRSGRGKKVSRQCARKDCPNTFAGYPNGQKRFCSAKCGDATRHDRYLLRQDEQAARA